MAERPGRRPTLSELARRLGVSTATVSLALNDHPRVSPATRARVKALARRLHYTPDLVARSLVTRRTGVLGLVVADIANSYFARLARRVEDAATARGFGVVIASTDEDLDTERRVLDMMLQRRVDGLVLTSTAGSAAQLDVAGRTVPVILLGRVPDGVRAASVSVDNRHGAREATRHLLAHGRTRVAVIAGPRQLSDARGRYDGYVDGLRERQLAVDRALVREGDFSEASGHAAMRALLSAHPRPDAVLVSNNLMLLGALRAMRAAALRVPEDIAVAGFDEVEWSDLVDPPMTMAEQPTETMGRVAIDLLLRLIDGGAGESTSEILEPILRIRRSCGCVPLAPGWPTDSV